MAIIDTRHTGSLGPFRLAALLMASTMLSTAPASAQALGVWQGGASADWFDPANWQAGLVPGVNDIAIINGADGPFAPVLDANTAIFGLQVGGALTLDPGASELNYAGGEGVLTINNGADVGSGGAGFFEFDLVGYGTEGNGTLIVEDLGTRFTTGGLAAGLGGGTGTVAVRDGAVLETGLFLAGSNGSASVGVSGGGTLLTQWAFLGQSLADSELPGLVYGPGHVSALLTGAGSLWSAELMVLGNGSLTIADQAVLEATLLGVGVPFEGAADSLEGSMRVTGGGQAILNGGGDNDDFALIVGGPEGLLTIEGAASRVELTGGMVIGFNTESPPFSARGAIEITDGGQLVAGTPFVPGLGQSIIGWGGGATGSVHVSGAGSYWESTVAKTTVGDGARGTITVDNDGRADLYGLVLIDGAIGLASGGQMISRDGGTGNTIIGAGGHSASVVIEGEDSGFASGTNLVIGQGAGSLGTIIARDKGKLVDGLSTAGETHIGLLDGTGVVEISGLDSSWQSDSSALRIGYNRNSLDAADLAVYDASYGEVRIDQQGQMVVAGGVELHNGLIDIAGGSQLFTGFTMGNLSFVGGDRRAELAISGQDSTWLADSDLQIAGLNGGVAIATITQGGSLLIAHDFSLGTETGTGSLLLDSTGRVFANEDAVLGLNSTYTVGLDAANAGVSGLIEAAGQITVQPGARLALNREGAGNFTSGSTYTIATSGLGLSGSYGLENVDLGASAFADLSLVQGPDDLVVEVLATRTFEEVAQTPNQIATAGGLESLGGGAALYQTVLDIPTQEQARAAFDALSGELHASTAAGIVTQSANAREAALARLRAAGPAGVSLPVLAYGPGAEDLTVEMAAPSALWLGVHGSTGRIEGDGNAGQLDIDNRGLILGADAPLGAWTIGVLGSYGRSDFNVPDRSSESESTDLAVALYGGTYLGDIAVRGGLAYTHHSIDTRRTVSLPGLLETVSGQYDAQTVQAFGELAYGLDAGPARLEPFANFAYVGFHADGFGETGGVSALQVESLSAHTAFTTLGLRAETELMLGSLAGNLHGSVGWRHAWGDTGFSTSNSFAGGSGFSVAGTAIARDAAVFEAGLDLAISPNASLGLGYAGNYSQNAFQHAARTSFKLTF